MRAKEPPVQEPPAEQPPKKDPDPNDLIDRPFDKHFGQPGQNELDRTKLQADLDELILRMDQVKHYVDRQVAHYDVRGIQKAKPTFNDLDECLKTLERLVKKYYLLTHAASVSCLLPTFQYDWQEIFRVPWITPTQTGN